MPKFVFFLLMYFSLLHPTTLLRQLIWVETPALHLSCWYLVKSTQMLIENSEKEPSNQGQWTGKEPFIPAVSKQWGWSLI